MSTNDRAPKEKEMDFNPLLKTMVAMNQVKTKGKEAKENEYSMTNSKGEKIIYFITAEKRKWLILLLVVLGFLFYWFQLRPSIILKSCQKKMSTLEMYGLIITSEFERNQLNRDMVKINEIEREKETYYFNQCLHEKGLK